MMHFRIIDDERAKFDLRSEALGALMSKFWLGIARAIAVMPVERIILVVQQGLYKIMSEVRQRRKRLPVLNA
jgi:hypothetical protein